MNGIHEVTGSIPVWSTKFHCRDVELLLEKVQRHISSAACMPATRGRLLKPIDPVELMVAASVRRQQRTGP
jgi:hypothetical protein